MKKLVVLFLTCLILFPISLIAQSTYWEETFATAPSDWSLDSNWSFTGGALRLSWTPTITNYDLSAISPVLSLPDNVGDLIVTQFIDSYSPVNEIMTIGVIIDGSPQELWEYELIGGNWGSTGGEDVVLSLSEFAGEDIQLQFRSYGSSTYNFDYWYIYNVMITALFDNDLAAIEVLGPPNAEINQPDMWQVIVRNIGMFEQNSFTVKLFQEGGLELGSINVSETIQPLEVIAYNFYWTPEVLEETELYGEVIFIDDEFEDNNITQDFGVSIFPEGERQFLLWDNDNDSHYTDPNTGITKNCEDGIEETLTANGIDYQVVTELPKVLRNYNVVFACLGLYCVG
ncbi:MAG: hypothetical protein U9P73_03455 [Candidatus Cloacimonadota bacterium]|nr:hypothetical protein [Candidatus Cloacimonadota bacterium]